ncbi:MAG: hypothetical protein A2Z45_04245 [Chloroflexi bacterium RBG_19FT_COMBO_55_16]|nr:MAG: hypothetical protein A2Z45_04245 [Chloroflexi bacterium RBG_19FT_COMBO_55_16]
MDWKVQVKTELDLARAAREAGNEGKARVCARRAAGYVIGEYLRQRELPSVRSSAYARLQYLRSLPNISPQVRNVTDHFLVRITPDHTLPVEVDLLSEVRWLAYELLADIIE